MGLLKMKKLSEMSDTPKSTILYYIKEGLLPAPKKEKSNLYLYDDGYVEKIRFIKYLQNNLGASISQIKKLVKQNEFYFSKGFKTAIDAIEMLSAPSDTSRFDKDELCRLSGISMEELDHHLSSGAISERDDGFSTKEIEVSNILLRLKNIDRENTLLQAYLHCAKYLSKIETELAEKVLAKNQEEDTVARTLLDAALVLKPYIMNTALVKKYLDVQKETNND